jgi:outer membrane protein OmpA-like peptidoglycan-associated protein
LDRAALTDGSRSALDLVAWNVRRNPKGANWAFVIEGHADRSGPAPHNLALSRRRAEAVRAYLVGRGLPSRAIAITYFGEGRPAVQTPDGAEESNNRRVVVTIVKPE